jgi:hypothetical protein
MDHLAENFDGEGFRLPMTIVVLDQDDEGVRIVLDATGKVTKNPFRAVSNPVSM